MSNNLESHDYYSLEAGNWNLLTDVRKPIQRKMMFPHFANRSDQKELIDGSNYRIDEYVENLGDLRRINRYLGGKRALTKHLLPLIERAGKERVRLLDVGTGSADIPISIVDWGRRRGLKLEITVVDLNEIAACEARSRTRNYSEITVIRADAFNLPFSERSYDFVLASLFLHHFENNKAAALLRSFNWIASGAFIVNDLRRHPIAYYSIKLLSRIFTKNRLVRNDSALSVLRGFTENDFDSIAKTADLKINIYRHFPYRMILLGRASSNYDQ